MLRPYQTTAISAIRDGFYKRNQREALLWLPTGSGKGVIYGYILANAKVPCMMLVKGRDLVEQASKRLTRESVEHGVQMAGHRLWHPTARVQVCSKDTLGRRGTRPKADIILVDEAHFEGYEAILKDYPLAKILKCTATPYGAPIKHDFLVRPIDFKGLVEQGYLVPPRYFCPSRINLKGVHMAGEDYNQRELAEAVDKGDLIADLITSWRKYGENRPTIVYAVNVKHSQHIAERFSAQGIEGRHCDADTPRGTRERTIKDHENGKIKILCNVNIWSTGVDLPWLGCIISARPTKSYNLFVQQAGRGTRPFPGKPNFIYIDNASNVLRHGFIEEEPTEIGAEAVEKKPKGARYCAEHFTYFYSRCPLCNGAGEVVTEIKVERDGELAELTSMAPEDKYLIELKRIRATVPNADGSKKKRKWMWFKLSERYGDEVADRLVPPMTVPAWKIAQQLEEQLMLKAMGE